MLNNSGMLNELGFNIGLNSGIRGTTHHQWTNSAWHMNQTVGNARAGLHQLTLLKLHNRIHRSRCSRRHRGSVRSRSLHSFLSPRH